jgi:hypothetical protein
MTAALLMLALAACAAGDEPGAKPPRAANPFAPSLPALTKEEEERLDRIIDRFMMYDIGLLSVEDGNKALRDFQKLGPESIPALLRGLNRAAQIEHSCPVVVIGQKLLKFLGTSDDLELLQFARDEIGSGVGRSRHAPFLQELRFKVLIRRNTVARRPPPVPKTPATMTTAELAEAAGKEQGRKLEQVMTELEKRRGPEVLAGLATVAGGSSDKDSRQQARDLLDSHLGRQPEASVRQSLKDASAEVRQAAVRVIAAKMPKVGREVIDLLDDDAPLVRAAARQALVLLSHGEDFGPDSDAGKADRAEAQKQWRTWWDRNASR